MLVKSSAGQNLQGKQIKSIWEKYVVLAVLQEYSPAERTAGVQLGSRRNREEVILHCNVTHVKLKE